MVYWRHAKLVSTSDKLVLNLDSALYDLELMQLGTEVVEPGARYGDVISEVR